MKAGDKVVCVDDSNLLNRGDAYEPGGPIVKGQVYLVTGVIRAGEKWPGFRTAIADGLTILGKPSIIHGTDVGWLARRFRLVSEVGHPPVAMEILEEVGATL